jgi:hypothetical protein
MFGYESAEEFCKVPVSHIYADPFRRRRQADELKKEMQFKKRPTAFKKKNGEYFWGEVTAQAVSKNGKVYFDGIIEDITPFKSLIESMRTAVNAADELLKCPDLDSLCRRAIELAREELNVERCAMFIKTGNKWQGKFGTDLQGNITDERRAHLERPTVIQSFLKTIKKKHESSHWKEFPDWMLQEWDQKEESYRDIGRGWLVMTAIWMPPSQKLQGVFFNDTARTGKQMDKTQQEIIAIYCCLLGSLIAAKLVEPTRKNVEHRSKYWKYAIYKAVTRICEQCPSYKDIRKDIKHNEDIKRAIDSLVILIAAQKCC